MAVSHIKRVLSGFYVTAGCGIYTAQQNLAASSEEQLPVSSARDSYNPTLPCLLIFDVGFISLHINIAQLLCIVYINIF